MFCSVIKKSGATYQIAQIRPVVYEVPIRVDRVGLGQVLLDDSHDHGHLQLGLVLHVLYAGLGDGVQLDLQPLQLGDEIIFSGNRLGLPLELLRAVLAAEVGRYVKVWRLEIKLALVFALRFRFASARLDIGVGVVCYVDRRRLCLQAVVEHDRLLLFQLFLVAFVGGFDIDNLVVVSDAVDQAVLARLGLLVVVRLRDVLVVVLVGGRDGLAFVMHRRRIKRASASASQTSWLITTGNGPFLGYCTLLK